MALPATVHRDIESYLSAADGALPGFVEGLHVTGSIPLGDYRSAISDVDLVAVCAEPPAAQLDALSDLHRRSDPSLDVLYVTDDDLASDPRGLSAPHSREGVFESSGGFSANPVTWRQLATATLTVRGRRRTDADVWFDADALRRWNLANLDDYWGGWLERWRGLQPAEPRIRHKDGLQWLVLGVPRLHHTVATLGVTSKTGAGRYALGVVAGRWHAVINAAIALRANQSAPLQRSVQALHCEAAQLSAWLIEDAHRQIDG